MTAHNMTPQPRPRTVVVAAATRHGSTAELAARIERTIAEHVPASWTVRMGDLDDVRDLDDADALVLGSAVYLGQWLRPAIRAVHHVQAFDDLDLWLFSTGPVSDDLDEGPRVVTPEEVVVSGRAIEHRVFGGRLDLTRLSRWERLVVRAVGALPGDRRDWTAVDAWAIGIADRLTAGARVDDVRS